MSITPAERKAVVFLAALLAIGAAARLASALRHERAAASGADAPLAAQLAAVDSQRNQARESRRRPSPQRRTARPKGRTGQTAPNAKAASDSNVIVDVDRASASELELLPRVGPVLAQRIVADREEHGPFGSETGLIRVKGIGPKLITRLAPHVTFSGTARPSTALSVRLGSVPRAGRSPPPG